MRPAADFYERWTRGLIVLLFGPVIPETGGKSVIMTGIMIAFGAKAAATVRCVQVSQSRRTDPEAAASFSSPQGRAKTMADLVTEETSSGSVTLALRNKGQEAFKPDVYGKMIYITRTITRPEGKSSYKIANYLKKKVSTTRDELSAICDHFNIQVENPVNVGFLFHLLALCRPKLPCMHAENAPLARSSSRKTTPKSSCIRPSLPTNTSSSSRARSSRSSPRSTTHSGSR